MDVTQVPSYVRTYVSETYSPHYAQRWLAWAPDAIMRHCEQWNLTFSHVNTRSNRSIVVEVFTADRQRAIMKLCPGGPYRFVGEQALSDTGVGPELLHRNDEAGIYVARHIDGATFESKHDNGIWPYAADIFRTLRQVNTVRSEGEMSWTSWLDAMEQVGRQRHRAADLYNFTRFERQTERFRRLPVTGLLHGDPAPTNVFVADGRVRLIDPEPHGGPLEADVASFCVRAERGSNIERYIDLATVTLPDVNETLLRDFVTFHSRTYVDFVTAQDRMLDHNHVSYANVERF